MRLMVIADELTGCGWRMAGADVLTPELHAVSDCLQAARHADLVLITAELAAQVPAEMLFQTLRELQPLVLVIPDLLHNREPADVEIDVRRALGIAS